MPKFDPPQRDLGEVENRRCVVWRICLTTSWALVVSPSFSYATASFDNVDKPCQARISEESYPPFNPPKCLLANHPNLCHFR